VARSSDPPPTTREPVSPMPRVLLGLDAVGRRIGVTADGRGLAWLGVWTTLVYVGLVFYPDRPYRAAREAAAWAGLVALLSLYALGHLRLRARPEGAVRVVVGLFPLLAVAALCIWPFHSADLYAYANAGHLEAHYGLHPYAHVPTEVPGWRHDPMFTDLWVDQVPPYGPLFAHLARGAAWLGHGDLARTVLVFKVVDALALGATGALAYTTARRLRRARPDLTLYLLLWSPYLLLHHVANGHNDLLMGLCLLLALRLAADGRATWAPAALALGVLVKLVAVVALPFLVAFLVRRQGLRRTAIGLLVAAAVVALVAGPYLVDAGTVRWAEIGGSLAKPAYSLHAALVDLAHALARAVPALAPYEAAFRVVTQALLGAAFLAFVAVRARRAARRAVYELDDLVEDTVLALIVLVCVVSSHFGAWYGAMFLPAALILPEAHPLRRLALLLTCFELTVITFVGRARILDALVMTVLPFLIWRWMERRAPAVAGP